MSPISVFHFVILTLFLFIPPSAMIQKERSFYASFFEQESISGPYLEESWWQSMTVLQCAAACLEREECTSFNYGEAEGRCQLSGFVFDPCSSTPSNVTLTKSDGIYHYSTRSPPDGKPQCCAEYEYVNQKASMPDGNYTLYPGTPKTIPVTLYCHRDDSVPTGYKEFVNLPPGILNRNQWPADEGDTWAEGGGTLFTKIRLNTTDLSVYEADYTFASMYGDHGPTMHPYGQGGGCTTNPIAGSFDIDLRGTPFQIRDGTIWKEYGWKPLIGTISMTSNNQLVNLMCDGRCGRCSPEGGLFLQLYTPSP